MHSNDTPAPGFTLIELIVVIAVVSLLAGTMVPLIAATQEAERIDRVEIELDELADGLEAHYFDTGAFPSSLTQAGFYGKYVLPGIQDAQIRDEWGAQTYYRLQLTSNPDSITVYSIGENGVDDGAASESFAVTVAGAGPGDTRTKQRMRVIAAVLAGFLDAGGILSGTWTTDRAAMGLGVEYHDDGYGTAFDLDAATYVLRSAGADRALYTADDVIL